MIEILININGSNTEVSISPAASNFPYLLDGGWE